MLFRVVTISQSAALLIPASLIAYGGAGLGAQILVVTAMANATREKSRLAVHRMAVSQENRVKQLIVHGVARRYAARSGFTLIFLKDAPGQVKRKCTLYYFRFHDRQNVGKKPEEINEESLGQRKHM